MNKLVGAGEQRERAVSHLSTFEINQPTKRIPIEKIRRSPYQPRIQLDSAYIATLAESIRSSTLSNPIVVRVIGNDEYELIAGENRLEAVKSIGETEILAVIRRVDDRTAWILSVADNVARKDLTDYEQGITFQKMLDSEIVSSVKEMAEHIGVHRTHIHSCLAFNVLPPEAHAILRLTPTLIGARLALDLKEFCLNDHFSEVIEAIEMVRDKKLTQGGTIDWIKKQLKTSEKNVLAQNSKKEWKSKDGKIKILVKETKDGLMLKLQFQKNETSVDFVAAAIQQAIDAIASAKK